MQMTNKYGIPDSFLNFLAASKYSRGDADISVTQLIDSPRVRLLREAHEEEIEFDLSDRIWSLFGTAVHQVLESSETSEKVITEERIFAEINGWKISGAIDVQEDVDGLIHIVDYKVTSVYSILGGTKLEWELQQNVYAHLIRLVKGRKIGSIKICAIVRDWSRRDATFKPDYPDAPVCMVDIEVWPAEKAEAYVKERITLHQEAQVAWDTDEANFLCSDKERWMKQTQFAVMKTGAKRALRVFDDQQKAIDHVRGFGQSSTAIYIQRRQGEYTRCAGNYCQVAPFCTQATMELVEEELDLV
tara:strand:- start:92 stop:997 length:906 start_codon:yes stop_codon:yes gene_type:complete